MPTTIQVDNDLKRKLDKMKLSSRDTYNDIIERVLEDMEELDDETKKELEEAKKQTREGKFKTHEEVKKEFGL